MPISGIGAIANYNDDEAGEQSGRSFRSGYQRREDNARQLSRRDRFPFSGEAIELVVPDRYRAESPDRRRRNTRFPAASRIRDPRRWRGGSRLEHATLRRSSRLSMHTCGCARIGTTLRLVRDSQRSRSRRDRDATSLSVMAQSSHVLIALGSIGREPDNELAPLADPFAGRRHGPPVHRDQVLDER